MDAEETSEIPIYELKLQLEDIEPTIWRRVLVPGSITLAKLHDVIQTTMGWTNSHLHQFIVGAHSYSDPESELEESKSEFRYRLNRLAPRASNTITYQYDFGDGWEHLIRVERIIEDDSRYPGRPICLEGSRACPPEDCGGVWGYQVFLEAIGNRKHARHKEFRDWIGGSFDPEHFDLDAVNKLLGEKSLRPRW